MFNMVLRSLVFLISSCLGQIISLEDNIIACLETDCSDYEQTKQMYTYDSNRLGDLTNKQFTLQFFVKMNSQFQTSFIAQVQTEFSQIKISQQTNNIIITNTWLEPSASTINKFNTNNWLSIYITSKSKNHILQKEIIIYDYSDSAFTQFLYQNFRFNFLTKFILFNNGNEYLLGQGCCIILYLGINYLDNYQYFLYNYVKPEARLVINIQQDLSSQNIIFDHSDYSYIIRLGEQLAGDKFDPTINKDNLYFSDQQYIYANDIQLSQQFSMEFRIALSAYFTSHIVLLNYSQPNWNLYVFLNQTQVTLVQDNFTQIFKLQTETYYHFCIAVIQNLEESLNYYNISFYQFSDNGTILSTIKIQAYISQKIPYQTNGVVQLGSKENQFQIGEYFQLNHFRLYDGFFLDTNKLIDPNCAIYLNDRCIICNQGFLLSDQHICQSNCNLTPALTIYSQSHNQCIRLCKAQCATCDSSTSERCITCYGIRITPPYCFCPIGYVDDYVSPNCRQYIPERSTQTGTLLLLCNNIPDQVEIITFDYKYTIIPNVALFLIGVSQLNFENEINLYIGQITEKSFQINIKCSFQGQFYKVQWLSSLFNHLLYLEGSQPQQEASAQQEIYANQFGVPQNEYSETATQNDISSPNNVRLLQTTQFLFSQEIDSQEFDSQMTTYPQILGWTQSLSDSFFQLDVTQLDNTYQINSTNALRFIKYSTIQSDFLSYNYNTKLQSPDSSIQIDLKTNISKSIKFVNIFQGLQKQNTMGNFSLNFKSRNSTFLNFSSTNQSDILQGVILFAAIKCDACSFQDLYLTSCNLNYSQCSCNEPNYYINETNFCDKCNQNCYKCIGQSKNCTACWANEQVSLPCNTQQGLLQKSCDEIKSCGDGIRSVNEECDDGNYVNRDGCSDCKIDAGYQCQNKLLQQSVCYKCQEKCRKCNYINSKVFCQECIDGYFIQNNNCNQCSQNCKNCISLQICTTCPIIDTVPDQDGKCPECQIGEQLQDGICQPVCGDGILGQGEDCDFGLQNGQGGCSQDCQEQKGFRCVDNVCSKIHEKQMEANYVNTTTKTLIQINCNQKANEFLCQSFKIKIDNFTQSEFNYTFTIENEKCNFQFNYNKTIIEQNLIRILVPQTLSRFLESDPREIVIIPRRQIYYSEDQVEQSKNVQSAQSQFKMLLQLLGPILALLGGFSYYLTILDILSWINNLYYINIQFPLNVQLIFQNSLWDDIQLFPSSSLPKFNQPSDPYYKESPPHFLEKGTDPLFINNTYQTFGLLVTFILGYFIAQIIIKILSRKSQIAIPINLQKIGDEQQQLQQVQEQKLPPDNQKQKIFTKIATKCKFFVDNIFSYFIKLLNLCYLDLVSAIVLQVYCFDLSQIQYKMILLNYILTYTSLLLCLYLLKLTWDACNQDLTLLKNKNFIQIYGTLLENLKTDDQSAIIYPFINLIRKSAYVITVVYFYNKPLFQTAFSCFISFINVAFIISYQPFDSVQTLIQYGVPDLCIFLLMLVFTIFAIDDRVSVLPDSTRYNIGWLIISIILISIILQLYFIVQTLIKDSVNRVQIFVTKIKQCL